MTPDPLTQIRAFDPMADLRLRLDQLERERWDYQPPGAIVLRRDSLPEDQAWIRHMEQLAATTCQCRDVDCRDQDGRTTLEFTWLEHCPLHRLDGRRAA